MTMYRQILNIFLQLKLSDTGQVGSFDMKETIENTEQIKNSDYHSSFINYVAGNCYYNGKLSNNEKLEPKEKICSDNIDNLAMSTATISKPLYLFHGFEPGINYNDGSWNINQEIIFGFHLSKTPAIWVAERFTNHFSWYIEKVWQKKIQSMPKCYDIGYFNACKTLFLQKYLFCIYDEPNKWHHISTDIRCPAEFLSNVDEHRKHRFLINEEFEYLTHKNEKFVLVDIVYKFGFWTPFLKKIYIMKRI